MENKIIHENKLTDKTYISKAFPQFKTVPDYKGGSVQEFHDNIRIISKVLDSEEQYTFSKIKDEIVIRRTDKGRQEIRATVFEESRGVTVLAFQRYTLPSGKPHETSFSFVGEEIGILYDFIENLSCLPINQESASSVKDIELKDMLRSKENTRAFILEHQELLLQLLSSELTKEDIIALGYRKKQLEIFSKLLSDSNYFDDLKQKYDVGNEGLWQKFFEKNNWIFGYGLNYVFNASLDDKKLEQVVSGSDFNNSGKRIDALLKTKGIIESFCFAEIKTHKTSLLKNVKNAYRPESWQVSDEITGAIAQVQRTVQKSVSRISTKTEIKDANGIPTGEKVFLYTPKSFIVVGSLAEFETSNGINEDKYSSFEMFRQSLSRIEIITFDELYQRALYIVKHSEDEIRR
nr:Shedu immune nuclease family protein [Pedobacter panaciterrae]